MNNVITFKRRDFNSQIFPIARNYSMVMLKDYIRVFLYETDLWSHLPNEELRSDILHLNNMFDLEKEYGRLHV